MIQFCLSEPVLAVLLLGLPLLGWMQLFSSLPGGRLLLVFWWRFIVLSQQLSGAAMVRRWSAYIHPRLVWGQVWGSCRRRRLKGLARRSCEILQGKKL